MAKLILGLIVAVVALMVINAQKIDVPVNASPLNSALPSAQRTAIHAPAVATNSASVAIIKNANANAAAQEQEAARVYAQAQADESNKRIAIATQQAVLAAQAANDVAVSKEYATLQGVSLQATSESISRTMAYDAEQYRANVALIQATKQAAQVVAINEASKTNSTDSIGYFWTWLPTLFVVTLAGMFIITLWKLIGRITPKIIYEEVDPLPSPVIQAQPVTKLPDPLQEKKIAEWQNDHTLAIQYIEDSIRENGGKSSKLLSAPEWEVLGNNRDNHTAALKHLRGLSLIQTKQGGKPEDQGTFVQEVGRDLMYLLRKVMHTPLPAML